MNEPLIALGSQKIHLSFSLFVSQVETLTYARQIKACRNCDAACPNKIKLNLRV